MRLDAGYTIGAVMDELTEQNVRFCGRIKKNAVLDRLAKPHLQRPPGRPPTGGYEKVIELGKYQAKGWKHAQLCLAPRWAKPKGARRRSYVPPPPHSHLSLVLRD